MLFCCPNGQRYANQASAGTVLVLADILKGGVNTLCSRTINWGSSCNKRKKWWRQKVTELAVERA